LDLGKLGGVKKNKKNLLFYMAVIYINNGIHPRFFESAISLELFLFMDAMG